MLSPPPVVEVRLRLGVIPADRHIRWLLEVTDVQTKELLAMRSVWHADLLDLGDEMARVGAALWDLMEPVLNPDPF